jgi:hypothetical protein
MMTLAKMDKRPPGLEARQGVAGRLIVFDI